MSASISRHKVEVLLSIERQQHSRLSVITKNKHRKYRASSASVVLGVMPVYVCSQCQNTIPAEDINVTSDVAFCRPCNHATKLSDLTSAEEAPLMEFDPTSQKPLSIHKFWPIYSKIAPDGYRISPIGDGIGKF